MKNENSSNLFRALRYPQDSELFEKLIFIVQEQFTKLENGLYAEIAMEAITIIYRVRIPFVRNV